MAVVIPTVHLNGTSYVDLVGQLGQARAALVVAMTALDEARPNARDYYPQSGEALATAGEHHRTRRAALQSIYDELGEILDGVMRQKERTEWPRAGR